MKKVLSLIIILLCAFTFDVFALNVEVDSVELESKTRYIEEISKPTINGTDIAFNIRFKDEEQKIVYKIVLKNNTKNDVVLDTEFDNNIIQYKLIDFDSNTIKANSSATIKLELYYKDEIDENLYKDSIYTASSTFKFLISGKNGVVKGVSENPKTGVFTYSMLVISAVIILGCVFMFSKNKHMFKNFVIAFLLIIPTLVIADNVFNASVDGVTTMEFVEPKRAMFDIGPVVNKKMHELSGDIMPHDVQVSCYDPFSSNYTTCYTANEGDTTKIRHITRAESLDSEDAVEVQAEDSDYKIWMWFDNGTIYYYSDEALIYYNPNSSKFFSYLSGLEELYTYEDFHGKYLEDTSYMFNKTSSKIEGSFNITINMKTKYIKNMSYMFNHYRDNAYGDSTFTLGELFTLDSAEDTNHMFSYLCYGQESRKNTPGTLKVVFNDNFNASNVTNASDMFYGAGDYYNSIDIDLGNNFNLSSVVNGYGIFHDVGQYGTGDKKINFGKNANIKSAETLWYFMAEGFKYGHNIDINLGDNFNAESALKINYFFKYVGEYATGDINIYLGQNFNAKSVSDSYTGVYAMFIDVGLNTTGDINIDFGNNFNLESEQNIQYMFQNVGYKANNVNIDLGNNFNAKSVVNIYDFFDCVGGNYSAGTLPNNINIDFGKNFNGASLVYPRAMFDNVSARESITIDFGNNFNANNVENVEEVFRTVKSKNLDINCGSGFGNKINRIYNMFTGVSGSEKTKIDFGNTSFDQSSLTSVYYVFNNFANDSNSVELINFPSVINIANNSGFYAYASGFINNSNFEGELIIDLSGLDLSGGSYLFDDRICSYEDEGVTHNYVCQHASTIVDNVNSNIKFKVNNITLGNTGKTIKDFIMKNNDNVTDNNFIIVN